MLHRLSREPWNFREIMDEYRSREVDEDLRAEVP